MNSRLPLRLVMAPLVCCLTLAASVTTPAAPAKKTPPPAPPVVEAPAPKRSFFKKLNPFQKKDPPPAPAAAPAPAKNSKKSTPVPAPVVAPKPPAKSLATARTMPPAPIAVPVPVPEEPRKPGFFSRLKTKLKQDPDAVEMAEKPARPADWKECWVVTEDSTAFFEFGPSQANGPDLRLPQGQVVKLSQTSRGWARVELEGGRQGYIGTDQMRQATETDFTAPVLPASTQLAAVGSSGTSLQGWSPIAPPPDLPDLPMAAGMEDSMLLLPPLEYEGTELKKSSLKLKPLTDPSMTLKPGDSLPVETPSAALEPPMLELNQSPATPGPVLPPPSEPTAEPPAAAEKPAAPEPATPPPAADAPAPASPSPAVPS